MTNQPSHARTGQAWVVLNSTYQSATTIPHDNGLIITKPKSVIVGESKPLVVATTHQLALEALEGYRKEMTSRAETAQYAVCLWRGTSDGVDIAFTPQIGGLRTEVRLRVQVVGVIGEREGLVGGEMLRDDTVDGKDQDGKDEGSEDMQDGAASIRSPLPEGQGCDMVSMRLRLHNLSRWSVEEGGEDGGAADKSSSTGTSGRDGIPVLARAFAGGSVDGDLTTIRWR
jgi:hypothetical protein